MKGLLVIVIMNSILLFINGKKPGNVVKLQVLHIEADKQSGKPNSYTKASAELRNVDQEKWKLPPRSPLKYVFEYKILTEFSFYPIELSKIICNEFIGVNTTNSIMLVNDEGRLESERLNRGIEYLLHLVSSLGIPTFTWFPDKPGQYKLDKSSMAIRFEPANWHIVQAMVDFMKAYNWTKVSLIVSKGIPNHQGFLKDFRLAQKERSSMNDENSFRFVISKSIQFDGLGVGDLENCRAARELCPFVQNTLRILTTLHESNERVILFHGSQYEMMVMILSVKNYAIGHKQYLNEMFGSNYIWICSPVMSTPVKTDMRYQSVNPDQFVIKGTWKIKNVDYLIPGMFAFMTFNTYETYISKAKLARELWVRALHKLGEILRKNHVNNETLIMEKLRPSNLCDHANSKWLWGPKLFNIMKSITLKVDDEYIGFVNNGSINTTELHIFNSQLKNNEMGWHKVGSWSMSSKWGKKKSNIRIDGVTWPGNEIKPPRGRPEKFRLKVTTIKEVPFVQFSESEAGLCPGTTIKCWIRDLTKKYSEENSNETSYKLFRVNVTSDHPYIPACCTGLTMDLLSELMKDLDFEVDLFEVPDGKWGGWTAEGWNGLVKILTDRTVDMAVTSFKITPNRSEQIDFSVPFLQTGIAIIVALREGGISPTAFLEPYDYQSWCVILVFSVHACGAALFIYEWLSPHGLDRGNQVTAEHKFSFFRSLWLIWSMLFGAAVNADNPRGTASRFLANIWALFALVFLASYTANLAAFMIAKDDYYDLIGIKDHHLMNPLTYKPPFTFSTVPSGATEENIKINFPAMYEYISKFNKSSVEEGIKALKTGEINAFIYDSNVLEYRATKDENCKLKTVGNLFAMTGYGVGFPKGSKWLRLINNRILNYESNGKMQRWKQYWLTGACKKDRRLDSTNKRLGVKNFISAFILLLGGIILCSILLLLEHAFYKYLRPHLTNIDRYGCCGLVSISMGQILNFEQSVNQTVDMVKHHKCSNSFCESKWVQAKNDADKLRKRVEMLEEALSLEKALNQIKKPSNKNSTSKSKHRSDSRSRNRVKSEANYTAPVERTNSFDKNIDHTPTFVYECTHLQSQPKPIDKFQLACLSPSQIYKPNNQSFSEKHHLLVDDNDLSLQLSNITKRRSELLEKESCL